MLGKFCNWFSDIDDSTEQVQIRADWGNTQTKSFLDLMSMVENTIENTGDGTNNVSDR